MKRLIPLAVSALLAAMPVTAGINSGMPDGFLDRGVFYCDASLNAAAVDQLAHYGEIADPTEQSELELALSAARDADPRAVSLLKQFLTRYPQSTARHSVAVVIGNCLMDRHEWYKAYWWYDRVGDKSLDPSTDALRRLNMGIALLQMGQRADADNVFASLSSTSQDANARFYRGYIAYADKDYYQARKLLEGVTDTRLPAGMAPYYLCQIYFMEGDNDRALGVARRLINNKDVPVEYRAEASRIAGEATYNTGTVDMAIPYLRSYVADTPGAPLPSALYILGMSEYRTGEYRSAIETLKSPSGLDDAMAQSALLTIGQSYMYLGDVSSAIIALNRAVELNADRRVTEEAYYNYCVARSDGGRVPFGSSVSVFEDFIRRFPDSKYVAKVSEYLAYGYMSDDNYEAALASIDKIKKPSPRIVAARQQVLYTLGSRDLAAGRYDEAIRYLDEARSITGHDTDIVTECDLLLGDCYYKKGEYSRAATGYSNYLSRSSASGGNRTLAVYNLGYALFAQKKYGQSRERFEQLLRMPDVPIAMEADATNRIADCYYAGRDLDNAIRYYDKAARIDPSSADYPMYQRAIMWGWKGDQSAQIDGLNSMIARFPTSPLVPQALLDIAEAYTNDNRVDDALLTYRRVEREYPNTAQCRQAMLLMGALQSSNNRGADAYETYCRLIKRHSPSREASLAARYLQALAAEQGRLDDFVAFMATVPNAPAVDPSEIDRATFTSARTPSQWEAYLSKYPNGEYAPQALLLLAQNDVANGDNEAALRHASRLTGDYPDGDLAAEGLAIKADAEMALGMVPEALESYRALEFRAADANMLNRSRLGRLKASRDLGRYDDVIEIADMLLSSSSLGSGQQSEVSFIKAVALSNVGRGEDAVEIWRTLAVNPADLIGAKSLYYMAQYYYDTNNTKLAWQAVNALVDSNTPHSYWLARGYILMSDLYRAQGDTFEADEYLKSLRSNYPGSEPDIFNMIDTRL